MKTLTLLVFITTAVLSQTNNVTGNSSIFSYENGIYKTRIVTGPNDITPLMSDLHTPVLQVSNSLNNSMERWSFIHGVSIASRCQTSGNGLYQTTGWDLNAMRIGSYDNTSSTPVWEFNTFNSPTYLNHVAMSEAGDYIAAGSYHNIYVFNRTSSTPVFNFNLETQLPDTGFAGPVDITSDGNFIIACASRQDSSWIFGFLRTSNNWVWRYRVGQTNAGGAGIQGVKISGNDSVVIVNTYLGVYVFRTYTGQLVYQGTVNQTNNSGTQSPQGISGNGNLIATINYIGFVRVLQWNGSTYNLLWQHQEPPGTYYNWMTAVDISYDGSKVACGTLQFVTSSSFDGKVKFFRTANGSTPVWTYAGAGDEVQCVSFSKNGNVLSAATWGDLNNINNDLLIFKISSNSNVPIYQVNSPGSFFWCSTSDDGSTVIASGKRIHARAFGNGGELYNVFVDTNDSPVGIIGSNNLPSEYKLYQNYPNPFNPNSKIKFQIAKTGNAKLIVSDILGREVATLVNKKLNAGTYETDFDGSKLASGIYFYKLISESFTETKKMILIK